PRIDRAGAEVLAEGIREPFDVAVREDAAVFGEDLALCPRRRGDDRAAAREQLDGYRRARLFPAAGHHDHARRARRPRQLATAHERPDLHLPGEIELAD